jgi:hypothetical protein
MICIIAMIVFGVMAIFSASYRPIAKEAFDCVFRRITLRSCQSGLNTKLKSKLVGVLMRRNVRLAKPVFKYFEVISWIFVLIFFVSLFFSVQAIYNLSVYDNCAGPDADPEECLFVPDNSAVSCEDPLCDSGECEVCGEDCGCHECDG